MKSESLDGVLAEVRVPKNHVSFSHSPHWGLYARYADDVGQEYDFILHEKKELGGCPIAVFSRFEGDFQKRVQDPVRNNVSEITFIEFTYMPAGSCGNKEATYIALGCTGEPKVEPEAPEDHIPSVSRKWEPPRIHGAKYVLRELGIEHNGDAANGSR